VSGVRRARTCATAALLLAGLTVVPAGAAPSGCAARTRIGRWTYVASPAWPAGDNEGMVPVGDQYTNPLSRPSTMDSGQAVVGAANPKRILLSNHRTVLRSLDRGCTWTTAFSLDAGDPAMLAGVPDAAVKQVVVPLGGAAAVARPVVYLTIYASYQYTYAVVRSDDDGRTWTVVTPPGLLPDGKPQQGIPDDLAVAPGDPATTYLCLMCHENAFTPVPPPTLYVTRDRGRTWTTATLPALAAGDSLGQTAKLTVDPVVATSVWLRTTRGIYHSADGGARWTTAVANVPYDPLYTEARLSVFHRPGQRSASVLVSLFGQHVTLRGDKPPGPDIVTGLVSRDDGKHWQRLPALPLVRLGFVAAEYRLGPLALAFDASGQVSGYLNDRPNAPADLNRSGAVLLRHGRWQAAHVPYGSVTYAYDAGATTSVTAVAPSLVAVGLDAAHGTMPAVAEYDLGA
jgi:hypothetical protein